MHYEVVNNESFYSKYYIFADHELDSEDWRCFNSISSIYNDMLYKYDIEQVIHTFNNYYISNLGRYAVLKNDNKLHLLGVYTKNNKVPFIKLYVSKNQYMNNTRGYDVTYRIDRLVAYLFIDNPYKYKYTMHIDGNALNNRVSNLKWTNTQEILFNEGKSKKKNRIKNKLVPYDAYNYDEIKTDVTNGKFNIIGDTDEVLESYKTEFIKDKLIDEIWKSVSCITSDQVKYSMGHVFKDIVKNPEKYEKYYVSNFGRVAEKVSTYTLELKPVTYNDRYFRVGFNCNTYSVHKLVGYLFYPNNNVEEYNNILNHKNEQKHDNNVMNLEFGTYERNNSYGKAREKSAKSISKNALSGKPKKEKKKSTYKYNNMIIGKEVIRTNIITNEQETYKSQAEAAIYSNCSVYKVRLSCRNDVIVNENYKFDYKNQQYKEISQISDSKRNNKVIYNNYKIEQYDLDLNLIYVYDNLHEAAKSNSKFTSYSIKRVCDGNAYVYMGYIWKYAK